MAERATDHPMAVECSFDYYSADDSSEREVGIGIGDSQINSILSDL